MVDSPTTPSIVALDLVIGAMAILFLSDVPPIFIGSNSFIFSIF
jgi:hypothetical protein